MSIAVLDLGTNTFNLLVAEKEGTSGFRIVHSSIIPVKLGRGGIGKNIILPDALDRAYDALRRHSEVIAEHKPGKIIALATSALRTAGNAKEFTDEVKKRFNIHIQVISGDKEAELIYYGVIASLKETAEDFLILDIGGGSNEFIIGNSQGMKWKQSFPIGIARLIEKFPPSDPVTDAEILNLEQLLEQELQPLMDAVGHHKPQVLIGASGAFDTLASLLHVANPASYPRTGSYCSSISLDDFTGIFNTLIRSTLQERKNMKGLDPARIEMIVYAIVLIRFVINRLSVKRLMQSAFSLKEGVMWCWIKDIGCIG